MNCKNCGHPHGWYHGLCAACAIAAGVALVPTRAPETEVEIVSGTTDEAVLEVEPEAEEPPKAPGRRRGKR